ncbi:MAG: DUF5684 domain-containing protein [Actinomycetota bacterium]
MRRVGGGVRIRDVRRGTAPVLGLVALLLLAAFFLPGCGEEGREPKAALMKFLKAEAAGDDVASYEYLSGTDRKKIDLATWTEEAGQLELPAVSEGFHFILADTAVGDDGAAVQVLIGQDDDAADALGVKFLMVLEGGAWKVSYLETLAGPVGHVKTGGGIKWSNVAFGGGTESTARTIVHLVMFLAVYAFYGIGLRRIARIKGLRRPWFAWVPVLNIYIAWKIAGKGAVSTVLSLIPIVNLVMYVLFCFKFARACGRGRLFGFLQLIPIVNLVIFWVLVEAVEDGAAAAAPAPQPA